MNGFEHRIDWHPAKAESNLKKHGVAFEIAATVFLDPMARSIPDSDHDDPEERWVTIGVTNNGLLLVVVHTWRDLAADSANIRIISARKPTQSEARTYKESV